MGLVKICGIRELRHMQSAAEAGADLLGIVFVQNVRRQLEPEAARDLVSKFRLSHNGGPSIVGLFANQYVDDVNQVAEDVDLDIVQLCGDEQPAFWAQLNNPFIQMIHLPANIPSNKQSRIRTLQQAEMRLEQVKIANGIAILDRGSQTQPGGTGKAFDWTLARELKLLGHSFLLAGGLKPDNVGTAIKMVCPDGVDTSSGVEINGIKDSVRIRSFVKNARQQFSL